MNQDISAWLGPKVKCPQCGGNIENRIDQLIGSCADLRCRGPFLAKKRLDQEAIRKSTSAAIIKKVVEQLRSNLDAGLRSQFDECHRAGQLFQVPAGSSTLTELPAERIERFRAHLRRVLQEADAILSQPKQVHSVQVEYAHRNHNDEPKPILPVINGCTTCRGYCCRNGGDEAFITPELIVWLLLSDSDLALETIEQFYLSQLPQVTVEDSCVFHTEQGCALDRKRRATICNEFHCRELQESIVKYSADENATDAWIAISPQSDTLMRIGMMTSSNRVELEVRCSDPPKKSDDLGD